MLPYKRNDKLLLTTIECKYFLYISKGNIESVDRNGSAVLEKEIAPRLLLTHLKEAIELASLKSLSCDIKLFAARKTTIFTQVCILTEIYTKIIHIQRENEDYKFMYILVVNK